MIMMTFMMLMMKMALRIMMMIIMMTKRMMMKMTMMKVMAMMLTSKIDSQVGYDCANIKAPIKEASYTPFKDVQKSLKLGRVMDCTISKDVF